MVEPSHADEHRGAPPEAGLLATGTAAIGLPEAGPEATLGGVLPVAATPERARTRVGVGGFLRSLLTFAVFFAALVVAWEGLKLLAGDPWRVRDWPNPGDLTVYRPPLR
ncbi:MAG TPA: hypothetical protein VGQ47_02405, partial [Candidatus Limnocylindrales bacterium]|nr:hypothetical protein [Candidatus Limnocylindrales bacterium]